MKSFCRNFFLIFAVLLSLSSMGKEIRTFTTIGNRSCQHWNDLQERQHKITTEPDFSQFEVNAAESWLFGYLSAYNSLLSGPVDLLDDIDADTIVLWMNRYCANNPKKKLSNGADQLTGELIKIKTTKN